MPALVFRFHEIILAFGFGSGLVTGIASLKVGVEAPRESDIGAVVLRLAIPVEAIVKVTPIPVVAEVVSKAIAGAIVVASCSRPERVTGDWRITGKASIGRSGPVSVECGFREAATRSTTQHLKTKCLLLADLESPVDAAELIVLLDEVVTGQQQSDV